MAFPHTKVADIIAYTESMAVTNHIKDIDITTIPTHDRVVLEGGLVVTPHLADFCKAIQKFNKHVQFGVADNCSSQIAYDPSMRVASEVWVYVPGDTYAMVRIGHKEYGRGRNGYDPKFGVYARHITNNRYKDYRHDHYRVTPEKLDTAVRAVKKYMRPYTFGEIAGMSLPMAQSCIQRVFDTTFGGETKARRAVEGHADLMTELMHLVNTGYSFNSASLREKVLDFDAAKREANEYRGKATHAYYVKVYTDDITNQQMCSLLPVFDIHKMSTSSNGESLSNIPAETYPMDSLPETIADNVLGKLAVLMMTEHQQYVQGVGMRVVDDAFWIQRDE